MGNDLSETPNRDLGPEGSVPNPRKKSGGEHSIMTSEASFGGHEQSMNRMSHPFRDGYAPNEESGEGTTDAGGHGSITQDGK